VKTQTRRSIVAALVATALVPSKVLGVMSRPVSREPDQPATRFSTGLDSKVLFEGSYTTGVPMADGRLRFVDAPEPWADDVVIGLNVPIGYAVDCYKVEPITYADFRVPVEFRSRAWVRVFREAPE
jgi:hypothetical protein